MERQQRALIVGLGIAGMSAARGLMNVGWKPVVIEKAPSRRTGGYFLGFFEAGEEAAKDLGVFDRIHQRTVHDTATWELDELGGRARGVGFLEQVEKPSGLLRGDIEAGLWESLEDELEVRFSTVPVSISQDSDAATVRLRNTETGVEVEEEFDLVIGADGLRSTVRSMVFGPHEKYMKSMNTMVCAYQMTDQVPGFESKDGVQVFDNRRALWVFPLSDMPPTALFTYRTKEIDAQFTGSFVDTVAKNFAGLSGNGAVEFALDQLRDAPDMLFDSVQQTRMPTWHRGRVVLLGDSAWCMTLFSGMGATGGLKGGAALARALKSHPRDLAAALRAYEAEMRPFVKKGQATAYVKGQLFVPGNRFVTWLRKTFVRFSARKLYATTTTRPVQSPSPA